jgi:2,6-dihydroxypyridine 3-monooxygenase
LSSLPRDDVVSARDHIAIVGGSLGGLTAALLLRDLGFDVHVYERSPSELVQRGAGIGFLPDAARYLCERAHLPLAQLCVSTSRIRYLDRRGSIVYETTHGYRFSSWNTVYRHLLSLWGRECYHLGHEMTGWVETDDAVDIRFSNTASHRADLLVCADGITSLARTRLLPDARPRYAGYVAWRGTVSEASLPPAVCTMFDDAITYYVLANSHVLVYPIPGPTGSLARGERLINFVWYRNYMEGPELDELLTDCTGHHRNVSLPPGAVGARHVAELRAVAEARLPESIAQLVCGTAEPFLQVICDIDVPRMAFGRVCLIGDAAFVARPHAAAGTAKAAADAWALADALHAHATTAQALAAWEPVQLALGRQLLERAQCIGRKSQFDGNWIPGDPTLLFGLRRPGE